MPTDAFGKSDIPESLRELMKSSIEQAKQAFDTFASSSEKAWASIEATSPASLGGMRSLNEKIAEITRSNADENFNLALELSEAKDMSQALEMQNAHARKQMETFSKQLEEIRDLAAEIITESTAATTEAADEAKDETADEVQESSDDTAEEDGEDDDEEADKDETASKGSSSFRRW